MEVARLDDILKQILGSLGTLNEKFTALDQKVTGLDEKVTGLDEKVTNIQSGQIRIEKKVNAIFDQTADLTEFRTATNGSLTELKRDVSFLKHKLQQNEEEIFDIKNHIKLAK
jgi:chromosome segregation ATPase